MIRELIGIVRTDWQTQPTNSIYGLVFFVLGTEIVSWQYIKTTCKYIKSLHVFMNSEEVLQSTYQV